MINSSNHLFFIFHCIHIFLNCATGEILICQLSSSIVSSISEVKNTLAIGCSLQADDNASLNWKILTFLERMITCHRPQMLLYGKGASITLEEEVKTT